jgi:hypothetical protein
MRQRIRRDDNPETMIDPDDIRRKAENLYHDFLASWLNGQDGFFPHAIRCRKIPDTEDLAAAIQAIRKLRDGSKEIRGFGYAIEWREINSRKLGRNCFPRRIFFECQDDFLRLIGKQREFESFASAVNELRGSFPDLEPWIRSNVRTLIEVAPHLRGLLEVLHFFRSNPWPDRFVRELPLPVDTKFIERHERVLRQWLDIVLPPSTIRSDEEHFERRYGLRYAEPHLCVRLLDRQLMDELRFPCAEFSLPLHTLAQLEVRDASVIVVENRVNLLTLPPLPRTIGLGGLGHGVALLRHAPWLSRIPLTYWGDLDVEGFQILSSLRALFPRTESVFMDHRTLEAMRHLATTGGGQRPRKPALLTPAEALAFEQCREENVRLEQERLPQSLVLEAFQKVACIRAECAEPSGG